MAISARISQALHALPKTELHLHIEGTLEPELARRLADRNGVTLPFDGIDDLRSHYRFDNQQSFLDLYYQLMSVLRTREDFSDLMFDYLAHAHADGVHRAEIFFDPQVHMNNGLDYDLVLDGLLDGIARGRAASGQGRDAHRAGPVEDGILRPAEIGGIAGIVGTGRANGTGRINGTNGMIARRAPRHDCEVSGRCTRLSAAASAHTPMYMDGGVPSPRYIGALCRLMIWDLNTYRSPSPPKPSSPM